MIKKGSLVRQMLIYFIVATIIILSTVNMINYKMSTNTVMTMTEQSTNDALKITTKYIEEYIKKLETTASSLAQQSVIRDYIEHNQPQSKQQSLALINAVLATDENLVSAVLITKDGRIISNESTLEMKMSSNMMEEAWYQEAIHHSQTPKLLSTRKEYLSDKKETWVISVTQEITDKQGHNLAILRIDISYKAIENYLQELKLGQQGYAFIVDSKNQAIYHPSELVFYDNKAQQQLLTIVTQADGYLKHDFYKTHANISSIGWQIVGIASLDDLAIINRKLLISYFIVASLSIVMSVLALGWMIKKWTQPILALQQTMQAVEQGNATIRAQEIGVEELANLSKHFNRMLDNIDQLMSNIKYQEQAIREYELKTLSSQINPHFLYNTLDTIIWMAEFNDSAKVVEITKSLGQFFRLSLNQGQDVIHLAQEIDHVRQYLFIQKQRYGNKLDYEIEELLSAHHFKLPKLVLQPIVENAIYHGIKEKEGIGKINIKVTEDEHYLFISIKDNGVGMSYNQSSSKKLGGVGMKNVDERLKIYFGTSYKMIIHSEINQYTEVIYRFKKQSSKQ